MPTFRTSRPVSAAELGSVPHLVLVGLPGAGKTTVGRAVAERLNRPFLDFDEEIERREGTTIAELFASRGEPAFRALEAALTREVADVSGYVLAPGGGWVTNPGCLDAIRPPATVVYLKVDPGRAIKRMAASAARRPLLNRPDPAAELTNLLAARESTYLLADHTVRVDFLRLDEVVSHIVALAAPERGD